MLSPSDLTLRAAGRTPSQGTPAEGDGRCAMCGKIHKQGDPVFPFEPEDSFTDRPALADETSRFICGGCVGVWNAEFTQTYSKSVICEEGVFPAAKNDHIAYWLMNPPAPPFLFMLGDQKRQHLVWRTSVNYSREVYQVRFGSKLLTIRRARLAPAVEACAILSAAASEGRKGAALKSPFLSMARELDNIKHAKINPNVLKAVAAKPELKHQLTLINELSPGEMWALTALLYAKDPQRPTPVLTPVSQHCNS